MSLYYRHKCKSMNEETRMQTDEDIHTYKNRECRFMILWNEYSSTILSYKFMLPFIQTLKIKQYSI